MEQVETIIIGSGQAGLSTSYWLRQRDHDHVILERADTVAPVWNKRWDSFTTVTPNWSLRMPGAPYDGAEPDGFMPRSDITAFFADYARKFQLPVRTNTTVTSVERDNGRGWRVQTSNGELRSRNVVVATGFFQTPKIPDMTRQLSPDIMQLHTHNYRNPEMLPEGAVLVVGSAMSACQIAEELYRRGRTVFLSTGGTGRAPRRYRGGDLIRWLETVGFFDLTIEQMPPGSTRFDSIPHISGADGGHTLNLHQFARDGVTLGRLQGIDGTVATFAPTCTKTWPVPMASRGWSLASSMATSRSMAWIAPRRSCPSCVMATTSPVIDRLDLAATGITSVIWGTGYTMEHRMVKAPIFDAEGFPIQDRGVTAIPGLSFVGLPWMPSERSGMLLGVGEATRHVASTIVEAPVAA